MFQKTVSREHGYSGREMAKINAVLKGIEKARKDPEFMKALKQFIKETT